MATIKTNFLKVADLSQLMSIQVASLDLNVEKNQTDNDEVLNYVNDFLDVLDVELKSPQKYKEYVFSKKDAFVRSNFVARLELVASRILEKKAMTLSTLSLDNKNFYQEELNFFVDVYFLLVTSMIDLTAIRKEDLLSGTDYDDVYLIIKEHMIAFVDYKELDTLRSELDERKDDYPGFPELQDRIAELAALKNTEDGDFVFAPSKSVSDYVKGEVVVSLKTDSTITELLLGELPEGLLLNEETGEIFVDEPTSLKAGKYDIVVRTADEFGGVTTNLISLPIGGVEIAKYEVAPYRVVADYLAGDLLARPIITDDVIEIVKAEWGMDEEDFPKGVVLDETTGEVSVEDEDMLTVGTYPVRVILTNKIGLLSKHEFSLSFRQDKNAIYTFSSPKALKQYVKGDVVATVKDEDGVILGAQRNKMPAGLELKTTGEIIVDDPDSLRPGTHQFNLVTKSSANATSLKTLFVTINPSRNPFYYSTSGLSPIGEINANETLAQLLSLDGTAPVKVRLSKGALPSGSTIAANGDLIASDPTKLVAGNYDLRFTAFANGIDPTELANLESQLSSEELNLVGLKDTLAQNQANVASEKSSHISNQATMYHEVLNREKEIADLQLQLQSLPAGTPEAMALMQLIQGKQEQLNQLLLSNEATLNAQAALITQLETDITNGISNITASESTIKGLTTSILQLKRNKWIRYEVSLVLTLEEDQPSAWHVQIPKDWDDYKDNEVIAQLIDCDGYDTVAILQGAIPAGLALNKEVGTIVVSNQTLLVPGEYVLKTKSVDKQKGATEHRLAIIIGGTFGATDEDYVMLPGKPANNYSEGEILGYPYNSSYAIVSGRLSQGLLPSGVAIDPETGAIFVEEPAELKSGVFDGIVIKTINTSGGVYYHNITISFDMSTLFDVTVALPKPMSAYNDGEAIVTVTVNQGILQGIQIVSGNIPGTGLHSFNGKIFVSKSSELVAGDYQVELFMAEKNGATDQQTVDVTIGSGIKASVNWDRMDPIDKSSVTTNTAVATPSILNRTIVAATLNPVPKGFQPIAPNGVIRVGSPADLATGTDVSFNVELTDNFGEVYQEQFTLPVIQSVTNSTVISAIVTPSRDFHLIKNGDILSKLHPEAAVSNVSLAGGIIPEASSLTTENGRIVVIDRYKLGRGITTANLAVQVLSSTSTTLGAGFSTKKLAGTTTTSNTLNAVAGDIQIVDVTIENKAIPNFADLQSTELFLREMVTRVEDFQKMYLSDSTAPAVLFPLDDKVMSMATWLLGVLNNPDTRNSLISGGLDSLMLNEYQMLSDTFMVEFSRQTDPLLRELIADLYNEMYTSQLVIFIFRDKDITIDLKHPVTRIIDAMAKSLPVIRDGGIDIHYMVNNALIISEFIDPKIFPNLKSRFSMLAI